MGHCVDVSRACEIYYHKHYDEKYLSRIGSKVSLASVQLDIDGCGVQSYQHTHAVKDWAWCQLLLSMHTGRHQTQSPLC